MCNVMSELQKDQANDPYEDHLLELSYKSLAFTGDFYDKLIYQTLLADGAIAGLIINQMDTVLRFIAPIGIKYAFYCLLGSAILGLLALFPLFMRKSMLTIQTTLSTELNPPEPGYSLDVSRYTKRYFSSLPWIIYPGLWWIQLRGIKPQQPYEKAAYWSIWQMSLVFAQVWTLAAAVVTLLWNFSSMS